MKLVVFSHKIVWKNSMAESGYATDGGFAFHMEAISEIFDETIVAVPVTSVPKVKGEVLIGGNNLRIFPLSTIKGGGLKRKIRYIMWFFHNVIIFNRLINEADAVHIPVPSDIGTLGMVLAKLKNKPLYVRYCGNWLLQKTRAEKLWKWFMEKYAGGKNVMLATGYQSYPPSDKNKQVHWIFSSSLTKDEIKSQSENCKLLDLENVRLIIVCRIDEKKGVDSVIQALNILKEEYPGMYLDVVGDGPSKVKFEKMADDLGIQNKITFHGKLNHEGVLKALKGANFFCFPTESEGFPKGVLEALASGVPVIAPPVSAIETLLKNGGGAFLEDTKPETLAKKLRLILANPESYTTMQHQALQVAKDFSLENWRDTIAEHLKRAWNFK